MAYRLSKHAELECHRRHIPKSMVDELMQDPQQTVPAHDGKQAYQSKMRFPGGKTLLLRAIVDDRTEPAVVVTVYRTSKIEKYWRVP